MSVIQKVLEGKKTLSSLGFKPHRESRRGGRRSSTLGRKTYREAEKEGILFQHRMSNRTVGRDPGESSPSCLSVWTWFWIFCCPQMVNISVPTPLWCVNLACLFRWDSTCRTCFTGSKLELVTMEMCEECGINKRSLMPRNPWRHNDSSLIRNSN